MVFLVVFLSAAFFWSILYIFRLKRDVRSIKASLQKIKSMDTNMRLTTSTFDKDVTNLACEMNDILHKQKELRLESERMNREFRQGITNISHDLRTPLTSASGYIGLIKSDKVSEAQKLAYLEIVENRLISLASLMSELFEYTQIVEGKMALELESVDVCSLVQEELVSFYDVLVQGNFDVKVDIPEKAVQLIVDRAKLQRVIQNLMGNVLKHGIDELLVKVDPNGGMTFTNKVADLEGLDVGQMFERFYTSDTARSDQTTGLGLAISKALIEQMGGRIVASLEADLLTVEVVINV